MDAEGSDRKTSPPPFLLPFFDSSEGIFDSRLQEIEVSWRLVHFFLRLEPKDFDLCLLKKAGAPWSWTCCTFCVEGFLVRTF